MSYQGDNDEDIPQWLEFTFEKKNRKAKLPKVTLHQVIIEEPPKAKKLKTIHHLSKMGSSEVIEDVTIPLQDEGQASPKYQISQVNLGKQTKWGELDTLELATSVVRGHVEKENTSNMELKVQLGQYKKLLIEIRKPLDSCGTNDLPLTSSLQEGEVKELVEVRWVVAAAKSWTQVNVAKIRLFLQDTMRIY